MHGLQYKALRSPNRFSSQLLCKHMKILFFFPVSFFFQSEEGTYSDLCLNEPLYLLKPQTFKILGIQRWGGGANSTFNRAEFFC